MNDLVAKAWAGAADLPDFQLAHIEMDCSGDWDAKIVVLLSVGLRGKIIRENPSPRAAAESRVRAALVARGNHAAGALSAATWVVTARPCGLLPA
jgi:hypothetical protein